VTIVGVEAAAEFAVVDRPEQIDLGSVSMALHQGRARPDISASVSWICRDFRSRLASCTRGQTLKTVLTTQTMAIKWSLATFPFGLFGGEVNKTIPRSGFPKGTKAACGLANSLWNRCGIPESTAVGWEVGVDVKSKQNPYEVVRRYHI